MQRDTRVEVSFGEWLKRRRKALGLTQQQLALQINCSTSAVLKFESEERRPSTQMIEQLAEVFHIPPGERSSFLRFARGDWWSTPVGTNENTPWLLTVKSPRSNLPAPITTLVGRAKEITEVGAYLSHKDIRLINLVGPPGIGKTRLSLEAARAA